MSKNFRLVVLTGLLIAITVSLQLSSRMIPLGMFGNILTGSLVNACLLISSAIVGVGLGSIVCCVTPLCAVLFGIPMPIVFVPFIAISNFIFIFLSYIIKNNIFRFIVPIVIKALFIYMSIKIVIGMLGMASNKASQILYLFSWPQIVTATIGTIIAWIIIPHLNKVRYKQDM